MASKELYIGQVEVTFVDSSTKDYLIYKSGKTISINNSINKHIVHASNQDSFTGVLREIEEITNKDLARNALGEYVFRWKIIGPDHHKFK